MTENEVVEKVEQEPIVEDIDEVVKEDAEPAVEETVEEIVEEEPAVEPAAEPEFCIVTNCEALNIREKPTKKAIVLCVAKAGDELMISPDNSTDDWYCVYTKTGVEGFCMKKFTMLKE